MMKSSRLWLIMLCTRCVDAATLSRLNLTVTDRGNGTHVDQPWPMPVMIGGGITIVLVMIYNIVLIMDYLTMFRRMRLEADE